MKKIIRICIILIILFFTLPNNMNAQSLVDLQNNEIKILIVYSANEPDITSDIKELDLMLTHFTDHVQIKHMSEMSEQLLQQYTHIFYYGQNKENIDPKIVNKMDNFTGTIVAIGENVSQFSSFANLNRHENITINEISAPFQQETLKLNKPVEIIRINKQADRDVLIYGNNGERKTPILIKESSNRYYLAVSRIGDGASGELHHFFAEALHHILPNDHKEEHLTYIRLEDIHPMSDANKLLEVGDYLNERNIPYILVVIPVYVTPETGERIYFSDSNEVLKALRYLQSSGGTVISHGYTHQYRLSETGEGFEFWDVNNNQFITANNEDDIELILPKENFSNWKEYDAYINELKKTEADYINKRLESSIHELVNNELYPLAFEAPHYTMSQQGYEITANYFSTIFGQVQLSDENWEIMSPAPFQTSANFLNGLELYPESIGYIDPSLKNPFLEIERKMATSLVVRDSMIGGFYHPYLGVEFLPKFLQYFEQIPNAKWINLKETEQKVLTEKVSIVSDGTGDIHITDKRSTLTKFIESRHDKLLDNVLWMITGLVIVFIVLFLIFTFYLRVNLKKRLFEERKSNG